MKLYAPKYYKKFKCIADKCEHNSCIGWEIDIDDAALAKYESSSHPYGEIIRNSIDKTETPHFRFCKNDKCRHLNQNGLCEIILNMGEDYLCHICREHPRFYNYLPNRVEVGIGMACREAARIILTDDSFSVTEIGEADGEEYYSAFDSASYRDSVYKILLNKEITYNHKIESKCGQYGISMSEFDESLRNIINNLEYLDESHKKCFRHIPITRSCPLGAKNIQNVLWLILSIAIVATPARKRNLFRRWASVLFANDCWHRL